VFVLLAQETFSISRVSEFGSHIFRNLVVHFIKIIAFRVGLTDTDKLKINLNHENTIFMIFIYSKNNEPFLILGFLDFPNS